MEYAYAALVLNETGAEINETNLKAVLTAADADVVESRVKALIAALEDVDVDEIAATDAPDGQGRELPATTDGGRATADAGSSRDSGWGGFGALPGLLNGGSGAGDGPGDGTATDEPAPADGDGERGTGDPPQPGAPGASGAGAGDAGASGAGASGAGADGPGESDGPGAGGSGDDRDRPQSATDENTPAAGGPAEDGAGSPASDEGS